jgi:hypothetical protein
LVNGSIIHAVYFRVPISIIAIFHTTFWFQSQHILHLQGFREECLGAGTRTAVFQPFGSLVSFHFFCFGWVAIKYRGTFSSKHLAYLLYFSFGIHVAVGL